VAWSREYPDISLGLHWDVFGEDERGFDLADLAAVREEFKRQLCRFHDVLGRMPTHIDSHRHAHREDGLFPIFEELVAPLGVPLRGNGRVRFVGGFYGQWEWQVTELEDIGVPFLQRMLAEGGDGGWTDISCPPGYVDAGLRSGYATEREREIETLTDPRIRETIDALGIQLGSYADLAHGGSHLISPA